VQPYPRDDAADTPAPIRVVRKLNDAMRTRSRQLLKEMPDPRVGNVTGSCDFNVTLINLMEPAHKCVAVPLKEEALYGMGNASVSWHSDSSLQDVSTVVGLYKLNAVEYLESAWFQPLPIKWKAPGFKPLLSNSTCIATPWRCITRRRGALRARTTAGTSR
jgi:hypothetical protein